MKPYYDDGTVTIYHGDCREVLPGLPLPDLVLTDPPYGMNYKPWGASRRSKRWNVQVLGDDAPFDPAHLLHFSRLVLFGANWYADRLPPSGGWLVWDKTPIRKKVGFYASEAELAWTNLAGTVATFALQWGGEARNGEGHYHPTQKPVALMRAILERFTEPGDLVVDPYCGSGSTLVAARETGRRAIGIELDESYCEITARRCSQEVLALTAP